MTEREEYHGRLQVEEESHCGLRMVNNVYGLGLYVLVSQYLGGWLRPAYERLTHIYIASRSSNLALGWNVRHLCMTSFKSMSLAHYF